MARPQSIPWRKRARIFVDYRVSQKVAPVAKAHGVARATVTSIKSELEAEGFSAKPRAKIPEDVLREMQEAHIRSLLPTANSEDSDEDPTLYEVGPIDLGPTTRAEVETEPFRDRSRYVGEELAWHLKGTAAEKALSVVQAAVSDYRLRLRRAWRELRTELETYCKLPELEQLHDVATMESESRILPALRDKVRNAFFDPEFKRQPPSENWLAWDTQPDEPCVLRLQNQYVAIGDRRDHADVKNGILLFLDGRFQKYQRRFVELDLLRHDLQLMDRVTREKRTHISEPDLRDGICPACPYPEVIVLSTDSDNGGAK